MGRKEMAKVKICGVTNLQDATWAATLGAEYIGFNFWDKSPRKVSAKMAADIISKIPPIIEPVGIFVDEEVIDSVVDTARKCGLKMIQLHGKEQPEYVEALRQKLVDTGMKIIKAFRIKGEGSLRNLLRYKDVADYFLLDTYVEGVEGGTGETFNWELAKEAKRYEKPIFLAGGLIPENVADAVRTAEPYAVDAASGIERLPRRKDYDKLKNFIMNAKTIK
jgi:phosphoribosylanthranilate isomerase